MGKRMRITILSSEITDNNIIEINNLSTPYSAESVNTYDIYVGFSATSVSSVDVDIQNSFIDANGDCGVVKLTNPILGENLYAIHLSFDKYFYNNGELSERTMDFSVRVNTMDALSYGATSFTIKQNGCELLYTIEWRSYAGGTILQTNENQSYGVPTEYTGATPIRESSPQSAYTFNGWSISPNGAKVYDIDDTPDVTGDAIYYAHFASQTRKYEVIWANYDNSILEIDNVSYGATPNYTGTTPIKPSTQQYDYIFSGWSPTIIPVTSNSTYTAQFEEIQVSGYTYTVTFNLNGHGTSAVPAQETGLTYNSPATKPTDPTDGTGQYTFVGWYTTSYSVPGEPYWDFSNDKVTNDITLYAHWVDDVQTTPSTLRLYPGNASSWGKMVIVSGETITITEDTPSTGTNGEPLYVGVFLNQKGLAPHRRFNGTGGSTSWAYNNGWVGTTYRFVAGFSFNGIKPYGVKLIHTDDNVTTEEIIPFNSEPFFIDWGGPFAAHDLSFVAHQVTEIIVLFTQFGN